MGLIFAVCCGCCVFVGLLLFGCWIELLWLPYLFGLLDFRLLFIVVDLWTLRGFVFCCNAVVFLIVLLL